jgi:hypothetical protein
VLSNLNEKQISIRSGLGFSLFCTVANNFFSFLENIIKLSNIKVKIPLQVWDGILLGQ